jgi:predicted DNA-binding transcriptional regulator AlpA
MKFRIDEMRLLTEAQAALYLGVSRGFLRKSRMDGHRSSHAEAPPYIKTGRMIRYCVDDLDAWIERHRHEVRGGP